MEEVDCSISERTSSTRDLKNLYLAIFHLENCYEDFPRLNPKEADQEYRWRYIVHYYPWLVASVKFAKSLQEPTNSIVITVFFFLFESIEKGLVTKEEIISFINEITREELLGIITQDVEVCFNSECNSYLLNKLYRLSEDKAGLLDEIDAYSAKVYTMGVSNLVTNELIKIAISKNDTQFFSEILCKYTDRIGTLMSSAILNMTDDTRFLDILFSHLGKLYGNRYQGQQMLYIEIVRILFDTLTDKNIDSLCLLLEYIAQKMDIHTKNFLEWYSNLPNYSNKICFLQALYNLGVPYSVFVEYSNANNDPILLEWLRSAQV